jgi:D-alanine transaminase
MQYVILNGELITRDSANIDIEDRGYQFGDGVYEMIRIYNQKLFAGTEHLQRLIESAEKIKLELPYTISEMELMLKRMIEKNQINTGTVYLQLTRGVSMRNHAFPVAGTPGTFVAYTKEVVRPIGTMRSGVKAILTEDLRWLCCDIKSLNLLGNLLAKQKAVEEGCFEAILHRGERVTEGSASNISMIKNGVLFTHPANNFILNGITRQKVLEICRNQQIPFEEKTFTVNDLLSADEVYLSSTTVEVTPIVEVDGKKVNGGKPGPITVQIQKLFEEEISRQCGRIE